MRFVLLILILFSNLFHSQTMHNKLKLVKSDFETINKTELFEKIPERLAKIIKYQEPN